MEAGVDFDVPEEHALLRDSIRQYFARELSENKIREMDRARRIPREIWKTIGELGWLGLSVPEEYGGTVYVCSGVWPSHAKLECIILTRAP